MLAQCSSTPRAKIDAALLVGIRDSSESCPESYFGFQCYADDDPDTDFKGNFGAEVTWSFDRFTVCLRGTGEST